jgi:hypothetical protein
MVNIYVLQLEDDKFYIGKTQNPEFRLSRHFNSNGSVWTTKYKPVSVLELIKNCDEYDEDKYTRIYMDKYGIENVRGGSFCEEILSVTTLSMLEKMKNTAENKCFTCGQTGHFAEQCTTKMSNIDCPDDIEELLEIVKVGIQDRKIMENVDLTDENKIHTFIILKAKHNNWNEAEIKRHSEHYLKNGIGNHHDDIRKIEQAEIARANQQIETNAEYLPLMEALYRAVHMLHDKIKKDGCIV